MKRLRSADSALARSRSQIGVARLSLASDKGILFPSTAASFVKVAERFMNLASQSHKGT